MRLKELADKVYVKKTGSGTYTVIIDFRNKYYKCQSHNSLAYDRIMAQSYQKNANQVLSEYTLKQALQSLYDECKRSNNVK